AENARLARSAALRAGLPPHRAKGARVGGPGPAAQGRESLFALTQASAPASQERACWGPLKCRLHPDSCRRACGAKEHSAISSQHSAKLRASSEGKKGHSCCGQAILGLFFS